MVTAMKTTVNALNDLCDEDKFQALFEEDVMLCHERDIPFPELPHQSHPPKQFCGPAPAHTWMTVEEYFCSHFFQVVDTAVSQLKLIYDQPGLHQYMQLENVSIAAGTSSDELKIIISAYLEMDINSLAIQLAMMRQQNWQMESVEDIATKLTSAQPVVRCMFDQVEKLVWLMLTIPCSNAEAERSFSSLSRLKTYLCNSMSQQRLNHLAVLHVHRDRIHSIDIDVMAWLLLSQRSTQLCQVLQLLKDCSVLLHKFLLPDVVTCLMQRLNRAFS